MSRHHRDSLRAGERTAAEKQGLLSFRISSAFARWPTSYRAARRAPPSLLKSNLVPCDL